MPNTNVNVVACEFRGHEHNICAGAIFLNSNVMMSSCKFQNFRSGAIFSVSKPDGHVKISDCDVSKCSIVGIYAQGEDAK